MSSDEFDRSQLTFKQAEGLEPLPTQLKLKEVSREMRVRLWELVYRIIGGSTYRSTITVYTYVSRLWLRVLYDYHIQILHLVLADVPTCWKIWTTALGSVVEHGDYAEMLEFVQLTI